MNINKAKKIGRMHMHYLTVFRMGTLGFWSSKKSSGKLCKLVIMFTSTFYDRFKFYY